MACVTSGWVSIGRAGGQAGPGGRSPLRRLEVSAGRVGGASWALGASRALATAATLGVAVPPTCSPHCHPVFPPSPRLCGAAPLPRWAPAPVGVAHGHADRPSPPSARALPPLGSKAFLPAARFLFLSLEAFVRVLKPFRLLHGFVLLLYIHTYF